MNWKEFFELKRKQRKRMIIIFLVLLILHIWVIKGDLSDPNSICQRIHSNPHILLYDVDDNSTSVNQTDNIIQAETDILEDIKSYIWFKCNIGYSSLSESEQLKYLFYRSVYTPLLIIVDLILAYLVSLAWFLGAKHKSEKTKKEPEAKAEKK